MTISISSSPSVLIEEEGTLLTLTINSDEPIPEGGLELTVSSELENALGQFDVFAAQFENVQLVGVTDDTSGFRIRLNSETGTITLPAFDDQDADSPLELTFSVEPGEGFTVDENAGSVTLTIEDAEGGMATDETPVMDETPATDEATDESGVLQVSLFGGPSYLIEDKETVSAHAFLATNGVIPEGGLKVFVDAPNLSEFDLTRVSVEGGEIVAVRDGGFDLLMTEYTTLVNLPIADDGETEAGETATFSLAAGDGYEIVEEYSSGTFNLVDTREDIPRGVVTEPNDIIGVAIDTQITPENPTFSTASSAYFNIGNRYLNEDGTYTYLDYNGDVDLYQLELSAGDTVAAEVFDVEGNIDEFNIGFVSGLAAFDADGNRLIANAGDIVPAAPDKLFGTANGTGGTFNEDGTVNLDETENYLEFTAPEDGIYYIGVSGLASATLGYAGVDSSYSIEIPGSGTENKIVFGNYELEIDLLTPDNPRKTGTPTPPVSNPNVTNPPTFSLSANPNTEDSEGNLIPGVVEFVEDGVSNVNFTIQAEGEIPEEGIELVLNSNANLFDYVSLRQQDTLPSTVGGQSLGSFYNEDGIPTGIRLLIEEPTMIVTLEATNQASPRWEFNGIDPYRDVYEPLETDGAEDVTFFLQPGEGYEVDSNAGTAEVTYYDSPEDIPVSTEGGDTVPEVGVSISETQLIETEGTETTLTFTLSEPPTAEGLTVLLDSEDDTIVGSPLSQFDVLNAEFVGGDFPIATPDRSGFFFNITEQTATITLAVFDELTVDTDLPPDTFQEGILDLTFALQPQPGYTIDSEASEVSLTIADNPDSQIFVTPTAATVNDDGSTDLIESEGTVGLLNLSLGAPPTAEGLTISLSTDSLADFDQAAIEVDGGTIAAVRDNGLDVTLTEREATVRLPILDDGIDEGSETATFTVEPGDGYETVQLATEVSFFLGDTLGQATATEEIEGNSTITEANSLGLSADNPVVSISGGLTELEEESGGIYFGFSEDVDFYSFTLAAGQTVALDIDGLEENADGIDGTSDDISLYPELVIFPEFQDIPQTVDTELRLFDAEGNELAANNDGAAPGEEFSRDPYLEYTALEAGTYYVGISQLGNRNYDPNVQFSGSGWTFPEVGVFFGNYELTTSLVDIPPEPPTTEPVFGSLEGDIIEVSGTSQLIFGGDSDDLIDASISSEGGNRIYAGSGDDTVILGMSDRIVGGAGDDKFFATSGGDNILTGGAGADQFWIATAETPDAANIITDFTSGEDVLGIAGLGIGFEDLNITQQDDNTLIASNGSDLAILQGIGADSLVVDNFAFV